MSDHQAVKNTDREIWRGPDEGNGSYYADSIHVTEQGGIGINVGGMVFVKPVREWHKLAAQDWPPRVEGSSAPAPSRPKGHFFECPDCGKDIADDTEPHAADCMRGDNSNRLSEALELLRGLQIIANANNHNVSRTATHIIALLQNADALPRSAATSAALTDTREALSADLEKVQCELDAAALRVTDLEAALKFYRDAWQYKPGPTGLGLEWSPKEELLDDCGNRAKDALARNDRGSEAR